MLAVIASLCHGAVMSALNMDAISAETGVPPEKIRQVAVAVLRELHCVATDHYMITTWMLREAYALGPEAVFHLGGILTLHDNGTNDPTRRSDSLMPQTVRQQFAGEQDVLDAIITRWHESRCRP